MTTPRIHVPLLLDGDWDSVIICTYGADLAFYERDLWRQLERVRNRIIFADAKQIARKLANRDGTVNLRQVNRTYVLAPMEIDRAAHAKLILLLRKDSGLLAVGSGNLGMNGYASQGECFTTYRWTEEEPGQLNAFVGAKDFIGAVLDQGLVDELVRPRVQKAWQDAPWIYGSVAEASPVRHNLDRPLLDQFIEMIDDRTVEELVVHAPFYDSQCRALRELLKRTNPKRVQVLLQERITSVDPKRLSSVLTAAACSVHVRSVEAEDRGTFLHAKFMIARCGDRDVCLQGSPNLSTPALLNPFPLGNIELANLLTGESGKFDHLVSDLSLSPKPVDVADLGLRLMADELVSDSTAPTRCVSELVWMPPHLTGKFELTVIEPPTLFIGDEEIDEVTWELEPPLENKTRFKATVDDRASSVLSRVETVTFVFDPDQPTAPVYPYHMNTLLALSSGHGRTDLLRQAGDFDLGDDELEQLLAQLDDALVVDGRSVWRMLNRNPPEPTEDGESSELSYGDLDWDAIQSHPKLAQYRTLEQHGHADPTALGILLTSIAERFRTDLERRRSGGSIIVDDPLGEVLGDLSSTSDAEDEEAAELEDAEKESRRVSERSRAKRQFQNFVKRFRKGIQDEEFVRLVGTSVIIPSYVVFTHLCWKLIQIDLADASAIVEVQTDLWRFFWGVPDEFGGYLDAMSTPEQEAALAVLDRHHAESVLLCSLYQAYGVAKNVGTYRDVVAIRDVWRCILNHPLWQPTATALMDAATILEQQLDSGEGLVAELDGLASYVTEEEPLRAIETALGASSGSVNRSPARVRRAMRGEQSVTEFVIEDASAKFTKDVAEQLLGVLHSMLEGGERDYIRIAHPSANVVAFADYVAEKYVYADKNFDNFEEFERPESVAPPWRSGMDDLYRMAGALING
ncbi:hypothetical protein IMCC26256_111735 [Actinobacteria bacterium IMCC26256]|nr:hypothetical protein IMCC26256_111735 [Actinobacteria bacterium IMCC26256]